MMASAARLLRNGLVLALVLLFAGDLLSVLGTSFIESRIAGQELSRAGLPNYDGSRWSRTHFRELQAVRSSFRAYYGWQHDAYDGETVHVDGEGRRRTYRHPDGANDKTAAFLGGSAMFGDGAPDDETIPSLFVKLAEGYRAVNFGTRGFVAHQSLNRLLREYYGGFRPDLVVSYDGFNEVAMLCQSDVGPLAHGAEPQVRARLSADRFDPTTFSALLMPLLEFVPRTVELVRRRLAAGAETGRYRCLGDAAWTEAIARNLLNDWLLMKRLTEGYGGTFLALLQPAAALSHTRLDQLSLRPDLQRELPPVYARIAELLHAPAFAELKGSVHDLTDVLDRDEYLYIDEAHVSPNGNRYIAERLVAILSGLGR